MQDFVILGNSGVGTTREGRMSAAPPVFHLLPGDPPSVLVIEGSRLFEVTPEFFEALQNDTDEARRELLELTDFPPKMLWCSPAVRSVATSVRKPVSKWLRAKS